VTLRSQSNRDLQHALSAHMRDDVLVALAVLPENLHEVGRFTVKVDGELVSIPNRVYHDPALIHYRHA
jgi:hypothetical protein